MSSDPRWYVVLLPGEETPELFGPFRTYDKADERAGEWNRVHTHPADRAQVVPIQVPPAPNQSWKSR